MLKNKKKTKKNSKQCMPSLDVNGIATYKKNKPGAFLVVVFKDIHGNNKELLIPASDVNNKNSSSLKKLLIDNGFHHTTTDEEWAAVKQLLNKVPPKKYELSESCGFKSGVYLQPDNSVIGNCNDDVWQPILDPNSKVPLPLVEKRGTLESWQQKVAVSALYSSRIMLTLSAAFSSYILELASIENGGFHLYGISSMGKSTCLYVVQSIRSSPDGVESWSATDTRIEELAAAHNDRTLTLDESGKLDSDPVKAARRAGLIIYMLTFGKDKCRSKNYTQTRLTWRVICLSTGERSLIETASDAGVQKMLGEEVRLVDVPADAGFSKGIYDTLPINFDAANYAHQLAENYKENYGTAETAFLTALTSDLNNDSDQVRAKIKESIDEFFEYNKITTSKGFEVRLAKRFALAYAGGKLAADYGILPFTDCEVMAGVSRCYQDSIQSRPTSPEDQTQQAITVLKDILKDRDNFLDLSKLNHGKSINAVNNATGFISSFKGEPIRAIKPSYLKRIIPNDDAREAALSFMLNTGRLKKDAGGRNTIQLKSHIKAEPNLPRCYCFTSKKGNS